MYIIAKQLLKNLGSGIKTPGFEFWQHHLPVMWPMASYLTCLNLCFHSPKLRATNSIHNIELYQEEYIK